MTEGASPEEPFVVPIGESDEDSPAEPQTDPAPESEDDQFPNLDEARQRASAAAAYGKAAHSLPRKPAQPAAESAAAGDGPVAPAEDRKVEVPDGDAEQQVEKDLSELAAKAELADEYLMLAQRTQADFENYRKRASRDAALAQERGIAKLAKELLPAIDNLNRAIQAATEGEPGGEAAGALQILDGVKLVQADLLSALQRAGIEPFSPAGEAFDPTLHEAVAQQPVEGAQSGTVVEVYQQGYKLGQTVLRPARVLVAA